MSCDREGCVWSLFQVEVQVLGMLSEMFRHPIGRVMESDRHPGLELRKEMWAGLGAWRICKCLAVVARTGCFHVTLKPASWLLRSSYALLVLVLPVEETLGLALEGTFPCARCWLSSFAGLWWHALKGSSRSCRKPGIHTNWTALFSSLTMGAGAWGPGCGEVEPGIELPDSRPSLFLLHWAVTSSC